MSGASSKNMDNTIEVEQSSHNPTFDECMTPSAQISTTTIKAEIIETVFPTDVCTETASCEYPEDVKVKLEDLIPEEIDIKEEANNYVTPVDESLNNLQRSTETDESMRSRFSCEICGYECARKPTIRRHIANHCREKSLQCNVCGHKFSNKGHFRTHIKRHMGEKHFCCDVCDYKCVDKSGLQRHMKTHTGEKPFSCNNCDYKCSHKSSLQHHMKTHTGEKPFSCNNCDFKCIKKSHLQSHTKSRH